MPNSSVSLTLRALETSRSVVVEACAGSGKTWLLASRIVRLLLAGVAPGEILAITFTRKAAREIEERVVGWLHLLAIDSEAQVVDFLAERGVSANEATLRTARSLYERVLAAQPGLAVNTFHGWFLQLVGAAPLSANLAGATLVESGSRLFDELWQSFAAGLQKVPESEVTQGFVRLLGDVGLDSTRRLMLRALDRRSEWLAFGDAGSDTARKVVDALRVQLGAGEPGQALADFFAGDWSPDFQTYLDILEISTLATDQKCIQAMRAALIEPAGGKCFAFLCEALLTQSNTLRKRELTKAAIERFTAQGAERLIDLHAQLGERLIDCVQRQLEERILAFNQDACAVFQAFLMHVDEFKKARRQIDFVDAEWNVLKLLRDEATAAFLQARLDARYSHVLVDEFQDTNPLQWQILLAWLDAYSDSSRPGVFLVGDPKQSIYRFRRAEPRLFSVAADFLVREFGAVRCEQDATRRNAQPIIDVVNALFLDVPEFAPFRAQTSFAGNQPGRVELLPLCGKSEEEETPLREVLRDPLTEPDVEPEDLRLRREAECLAAKISEMLGHSGNGWQIEEKGVDGQFSQRAVRYGDIMLLVRTRTNLACYERALTAANIPFDAGSRGGLLAALEVRDIVALLEFLVTPVANLKLAQILRSPVFACSDDELMQLAARPFEPNGSKTFCHSGLDPESDQREYAPQEIPLGYRVGDAPLDSGFRRNDASWWQRLEALVREGDASPRLARAACLLGEWLQAADRLPAHDLLDRIFHQGEVLERYRLAVPEAVSASVQANLHALLLLALDLDGGRYPSLPRFIDELRDLRDVDTNDAPDEGVIEVQNIDTGRVRILTIHGAKGLEAPIVWLLGANAMPRPPDPWDVLVDWPPQASSPQHFSFYGRKEDHGIARRPLFDAEAAAAKREELNLLYVAMTRARQVFIASGIENSKAGSETPYRRLETALAKLGSGLSYGDVLPLDAANRAKPTGAAPSVATPLPPVGEQRRMPDAAERFGIFLHALLERRTTGDASEGWWKDLGFDDGEYRRVLPVAERLLAAPLLQRFFDPTQYNRAWNEVELTTGDGELLRIDRLVEFNESENALWVLDYKSSGSDTARLDEYHEQVAGYCRAMTSIFKQSRVRGALIFADASLVQVY